MSAWRAARAGAVALTLGLGTLISGYVAGADGVRLKDLGRFEGWRDNQLVGYGVVTGLAGTGDSLRSRATRQSIANILAQFDLNVPQEQIQSRNVATVMVTARMPSFVRTGDKLDVTITSMGDARSLLGGALLMTALKGPDGKVYALAQGALNVGGYKYDLNGNVVQKNHPTTGIIPAGANLEVDIVPDLVTSTREVAFVLVEPDLTTAGRIVEVINRNFSRTAVSAYAQDPGKVRIDVSGEAPDRLVSLLTRIEDLRVQPDVRARVVVNERTGTVVAGGDVRLSKITVTHGDLKVSITTDYNVSQPDISGNIGRVRTGPGVRTVVVPSTRIDVNESAAESVSLRANSTVSDLVYALNRIKTSPRDMIAILQGIKAAGALHAELVIQ